MNFSSPDPKTLHPGRILKRDFLDRHGIFQQELAKAIHVSFQRINQICNGKRGITPGTALRFGKFFDNDPAFWMDLQSKWDLAQALKKEEPALSEIEAFKGFELIN